VRAGSIVPEGQPSGATVLNPAGSDNRGVGCTALPGWPTNPTLGLRPEGKAERPELTGRTLTWCASQPLLLVLF
jgi:hypothetical protein